MTDEIDYSDDSLFPTRGLIPEVDAIRDRKMAESDREWYVNFREWMTREGMTSDDNSD